MKRILVNKYNDVLRVARTDGQKLYDLEIEQADRIQNVDSVCNGEIVSIEPSLEAAFVNFGSVRNGFLPLKEIASQYYPDEFRGRRGPRPGIKDVLFEGQKVLIQVNKGERGTKGAALSTYISLAGSYLVLMPNNAKAGGISRRIEGEERDELKRTLNQLRVPRGMGVIIRTAGLGKAVEELQWDLDVLLQLWESIQAASKTHGAPHLIHQESDIAIRAVRDHLRQDTSEILVDNTEVYEKVRNYIERVRPDFIDRVKLYQDKLPLFSRFQIEKQIETAYQREVRLPSGGEIVIDRAEALTAIDINSAQATKGQDIEATALHTNLEAADEIAKQLRIRDLGGLIVIDFIDMEIESNIRQVENRMREALQTDRARIQLAPISRFGLLEMSRQRLRPSLTVGSLVVCPRCHGQGSIRSIESQAMTVMHLIEEAAQKKNTNEVRAQLPTALATFLLNEHRQHINTLEAKLGLAITVIANPYMELPNYEIESLTTSGRKPASYDLIKAPTVEYEGSSKSETPERQKAAVELILPETRAPISARKKKKEAGALKRLLKKLFGKEEKKKPRKDQRKTRGRGHTSRTRSTTSRGSRSSNTRRRPSGSNYRRSRQQPTERRQRAPQREEKEVTESSSVKQSRTSQRPQRAPKRQEHSPKRQERGTQKREQKRPEAQQKSTRTEQTSKPKAPVSKPAPKKEPVKKEQIKQEALKKEPVKKEQIKQEVPKKPAKTFKPVKPDSDVAQVETKHAAESMQQPKAEKRGRTRPISDKAKHAEPEAFEMVETKK